MTFGFDPKICNPNRLRLLVTLANECPNGKCPFTELRDAVGLTDGNLASHIRCLKKLGFVETEKTFWNNYPRTFVRITEKGLTELCNYAEWLVDYVLDAIPTGRDRRDD